MRLSRRGLPTRQGLTLLALVLGLGLTPGGTAPRAEERAAGSAPAEVPVRVERVKPLGDRLPMLRFLRDNRDFLRGRSDALRARPGAGTGAAAALDPRLVDYPALREAARAEQERTTAAADSLQRLSLLARFQELLDLEAEMGRLEARFAGAGERMTRLERDFGGTPTTALVLLVRGLPETAVDSVIVTNEFGERRALALTGETALGLRNGGLARLLHEFVEPRSQWLEVRLSGAAWHDHASAYVVFEPLRDRATVIELDLRPAAPTPNAPGIAARGWIDEPLLGSTTPTEAGH